MPDLLDREPSYIPAGFTLRKKFKNGAEGGLGAGPNQTVLYYTAGWTNDDWTSPLQFCIGLPGAPDLIATEHRAGQSLQLAAGLQSVYHDGLWVGPKDKLRARQWLQGTAHSITVRTATIVVAARSSRQLAVAELARIIMSFPFEG